MKLVLYTTHCPKCKVIESKLKAKNIKFDIVDNKEELLKMGIVSVPVLEADGKKMAFLDANKYVNSL